MPFNRNHVRTFLAKTEIDLFESSLDADLRAPGAVGLQRRIDRARTLRDKYQETSGAAERTPATRRPPKTAWCRPP